jgi:hypothetical protein
MTKDIVLIISGKMVLKNSKIDWPDMNYPGSGQTILRTIHNIDTEKLKIQLDGADGPWFYFDNLPEGVGFYAKLSRPLQPTIFDKC